MEAEGANIAVVSCSSMSLLSPQDLKRIFEVKGPIAKCEIQGGKGFVHYKSKGSAKGLIKAGTLETEGHKFTCEPFASHPAPSPPLPSPKPSPPPSPGPYKDSIWVVKLNQLGPKVNQEQVRSIAREHGYCQVIFKVDHAFINYAEEEQARSSHKAFSDAGFKTGKITQKPSPSPSPVPVPNPGPIVSDGKITFRTFTLHPGFISFLNHKMGQPLRASIRNQEADDVTIEWNKNTFTVIAPAARVEAITQSVKNLIGSSILAGPRITKQFNQTFFYALAAYETTIQSDFQAILYYQRLKTLKVDSPKPGLSKKKGFANPGSRPQSPMGFKKDKELQTIILLFGNNKERMEALQNTIENLHYTKVEIDFNPPDNVQREATKAKLIEMISQRGVAISISNTSVKLIGFMLKAVKEAQALVEKELKRWSIVSETLELSHIQDSFMKGTKFDYEALMEKYHAEITVKPKGDTFMKKGSQILITAAGLNCEAVAASIMAECGNLRQKVCTIKSDNGPFLRKIKTHLQSIDVSDHMISIEIREDRPNKAILVELIGNNEAELNMAVEQFAEFQKCLCQIPWKIPDAKFEALFSLLVIQKKHADFENKWNVNIYLEKTDKTIKIFATSKEDYDNAIVALEDLLVDNSKTRAFHEVNRTMQCVLHVKKTEDLHKIGQSHNVDITKPKGTKPPFGFLLLGVEKDVQAAISDMNTLAAQIEKKLALSTQVSVSQSESKLFSSNGWKATFAIENKCGVTIDIPSFSDLAKTCRYPIGTKSIEIRKGNILKQEVDCIVIPGNEKLDLTNGIAAEVLKQAGPVFQQECVKLIESNGKLKLGEAVATLAGNLPFKFVIHAVGPAWEHKDSPKTLEIAVANALNVAQKKKCESIAIPMLSTGTIRFPSASAQYYLRAAVKHLNSSSCLQTIVFVDKDLHCLSAFKSILESGKPEDIAKTVMDISKMEDLVDFQVAKVPVSFQGMEEDVNAATELFKKVIENNSTAEDIPAKSLTKEVQTQIKELLVRGDVTCHFHENGIVMQGLKGNVAQAREDIAELIKSNAAKVKQTKPSSSLKEKLKKWF